MGTNADATAKPGSQLWGIYHSDGEYARVMSDPIRTVLEAPTSVAAKEAADRLGFGDGRILPPWHGNVFVSAIRPGKRRAMSAQWTRGRTVWWPRPCPLKD